MASSSTAVPPGPPPRSLSRRMTRAQTMMVDLPDGDSSAVDSELVPSSLDSIVPVLRVANDIEADNPRVAYLCRFHAFDKAHKMDPHSSGRGVRQFKTYLLHRLEKEEEETRPLLPTTYPREIMSYYQKFYEDNIREGEYTKKPEEMAKVLQIASVLYDVLKTVVPLDRIGDQIKNYAKDVEAKREQYEHYNILPLYATGLKPAIMELPEIKSALHALHKVDNLPMPRATPRQDTPANMPMERTKSANDILDWLSSIFGFQRGNVANQREHLILLLANLDVRDKNLESYSEISNLTVQELADKIFKNYRSWYNYLHIKSNLRYPAGCDKQQLKLIYIALYLLIWGEASNLRFMPECLCYIFHNMAGKVHEILSSVGATYDAAPDEETFLRTVITPIYQVLQKEAKRNRGGTASHSTWRNYDDLNEHFWSKKCFQIKWPLNLKANFFAYSEDKLKGPSGNTRSKTNFVEIRTFFHLYRSFDRMWIFFVLAFQAMMIVAWSGSISSVFDEDVSKSVSSIFITYAFLNLLTASLDIILSVHAWRSLKATRILRSVLKFLVAVMWAVVLPIGYSSSVHNPTGLVKFFGSWGRNWHDESFYYYAVTIFLIPNLLGVILFVLPCMRRHLERSNWRIINLILWWSQPRLFVGRGMHEGFSSLLKYTLFWILLLISKLAFSYYVEESYYNIEDPYPFSLTLMVRKLSKHAKEVDEFTLWIAPLVTPTKLIMELQVDNYRWPDIFSHVNHNIGVVIAVWAPIVLVYFMDTQIWYAIFSTLVGGILGAFSHLGEIRTLGMLRSRFQHVPRDFSKYLMPSSQGEVKRNNLVVWQDDSIESENMANFSEVWNTFIHSMRMEDLLNNQLRERDLLLVPYSSTDVSVVQWPPFLLASKIPIALDIAKDFKGKDDMELFNRMDPYMHSAVTECYETLRDVIYNLLEDNADRTIVRQICYAIDMSIQQRRFLNEFRTSGLPLLSDMLEKFLKHLVADYEDEDKYRSQIINVLQDIIEVITQDIMIRGAEIIERAHSTSVDPPDGKKEERFGKININLTKSKNWREKVVRLHLLLTTKESAINVPSNLDARRRITFFANSLCMRMPVAPKVRDMLSFSVLTPYYKEDVLYSEDDLEKENEDGITMLFYLQTIYRDEWKNFEERIHDPKFKYSPKEKMEFRRQWVSYRGQTLARTVRGMMYYRQALELQCFLEFAGANAIFSGYRTMDMTEEEKNAFLDQAQALADLKFTYVVSCQIYGAQKKSSDLRDRSCYSNILNLMLTYPQLRVAYIDEREETVDGGKSQKIYYSVLVKGGDKLDEEIYRIKLPGPPTEIGEGKPENQNHAIIFTRGEALQTIDMNQDNYFEEAFKMRNVLEELRPFHRNDRKPTILGLREHIFTGSVSSLAWFMSNQETSFVTIGQRVLANPLRVRFHYGHPDIFDRIFHITRGGISKASKIINLSEDIFSGFNSTLRGGFVTHHEYIQVGKGRDVGMNQISAFEAKVANGNGEQTLSRDVYRLGHQFDFYRMLSFYFTTVGFYFNSMVTVLTVYAFLYGRLYIVMSGLERAILASSSVLQSKVLEQALATQSVVQLGLLLVLPMFMEIGLEKGFRTALGDFVIMQLQLASVFFTFQLGTKAHYFGRTILHGGSKYRATGRGFVVFHAKFAENYRTYSRSHFVKGLELFMLLVLYEVYGESRSSKLYFFITFSMWFLVASWMFAPFVFNPSGFDWQKTVDDWTDWKRWMGNRGGIGIPTDKSWESWWEGEQEHLRNTSIRGRVCEIILACRFFVYQYGIVYQLDISRHSKSALVYGLSWVVMIIGLLVLKLLSMGRRKFGTDLQLMFRILKVLLFLGFVSVMAVLFIVANLTVTDVLASFLAFLPTGWALLLIGQACRKLFEKIGLWESIKEQAIAYEYLMGILIFTPIAVLSWFPFVSEFQTRLLFNQAFSRGLQISMILAGKKSETELGKKD